MILYFLYYKNQENLIIIDVFDKIKNSNGEDAGRGTDDILVYLYLWSGSDSHQLKVLQSCFPCLNSGLNFCAFLVTITFNCAVP